jgi:hypothetical protein
MTTSMTKDCWRNITNGILRPQRTSGISEQLSFYIFPTKCFQQRPRHLMKDLVFRGTRGYDFPRSRDRWFWFWAQEVIFSKPREWSIWFLRAHGVNIFPNQRKKNKAKCLSWKHLIDRFCLLPYVSFECKQTDWTIVLACLSWP